MKLVNVDDHIDLVYEGLNSILAKIGGTWHPDYYIDLCRQKKAFLFVVDEGFFILRPRVIPTLNDTWVECAVAYARKNATTTKSLISKYLPVIDQLVRDFGASKWTFVSPRKGYIRLSAFSIRSITYERDI